MLEKLPDVVGHLLREQRAGTDKLLLHKSGLRAGMGLLQLGSLAFADHAPIPARYTPDGEGISPPLQWTGVPTNAASLVLVVEDPDAPTPEPLVHAIVVDLPPEDGHLGEGAIGRSDDDAVHEGRNSALRATWLPPDPPPGHGTHHYWFQLYALGPGEPFTGTPGRDAVLQAIRERGLAAGWLVGTYARPDGSIPDDPPQAVVA